MLNKSVFITVIIPAYNAEKDISKCVTTLQNQSYSPNQIIIVDDGSNDKTWEILQELAALDSSIRIIHQDNGGVSRARNMGLANMSPQTTHVCFVDSDDSVDSDFIRMFVKNIEFGGGKLLVQGYNMCFNSNKQAVYYRAETPLIQLMFESGTLGHVYDKCFEADVIRSHKIRFNPKFSFGEDSAFVLDYMQYVSELKYIDTAQYNYNIPVGERYYLKENNMGMYFYCLQRINHICKKSNLPLHITAKLLLVKSAKQFFKPSNYKLNSEAVIQSYFKIYAENTSDVPAFFSTFHFLARLVVKSTLLQRLLFNAMKMN